MQKLFIIFTFTLTLFIFTNISINAADTPPNIGDSGSGNPPPPVTVTLDDPLKGATPQTLIGRIIKGILGIVGSLALLMFIYGGFTWMTAAGSSEGVTKGKNILIWATMGLIVIFSSYALVTFVFEGIGAKQ